MISLNNRLSVAVALGLLVGCGSSQNTEVAVAPAVASPASAPAEADATASTAAMTQGHTFATNEIAKFDAPWAMVFLPDGRLLVTEMAGALRVYDPASQKTGTISGTPDTTRISQGGLGDVVLHPQYADNGMVYLSFVETDDSGRGGAVARAKLVLDGEGGGNLENLEVIWRQSPKMPGEGHFGYRIAFDGEGMLWISSSERQEFDPAQDLATNLGKIIRLKDDGSLPPDNPFADRKDVGAQAWSLGHRNILGMAFDGSGQLWAHEMGPKGGDEFNRIEKGFNYGYPIVSNGDHYDGRVIPDHDTRPEFIPPAVTWNPVISPAGLVIYSGTQFPAWQGDAFIGGLSSKALVRVEFDGKGGAQEAQRFDMQRRIREVEQGPDGALWLLEDGNKDGQGWLLKLTPSPL